MGGSIDVSHAGHAAYVTIKNPAKRNAMTQAMWIAMGDIMLELGSRRDIRCIVLRGAGEAAFGSGADIEEFRALRADRQQAIAFARDGHRAMQAVRDCPVPTLAAIRGACVGGGLELAAFCDIRIAASDSRFGVPIARLGAVLAYPELEGLVRLAGPVGALEILLEGRLLNADEACRRGLVSRVVDALEFEREVADSVGRIIAGGPLNARWHKKFVARLGCSDPLTEAELDEGYACYDTEDYQIGYQAFLAKQAPEFIGK